MARRFTDTEKWRDEWWGSLSNDYRMVWLYLVDSCSIAGIWKKDFRGLNFNCNTKITEEEFLEVFGSRVIDKGNFFFIPKYLRFQCPSGLGSKKPAVVSIVRELQLNNLIETVQELFGNGFLTIKGKNKDKDKEKTKEKEKEGGAGGTLVTVDDRDEYPSDYLERDEGKWELLERCARDQRVDLRRCADDWDAWYVNKFPGWRADYARGQLVIGGLYKSLESWIRDPKSKKQTNGTTKDVIAERKMKAKAL